MYELGVPLIDVNDADELYQTTKKTTLPPLKQTKEIDLKSDEKLNNQLKKQAEEKAFRTEQEAHDRI